MQRKKLSAEWQGADKNIKFDVQVLFFQEDKIHFAYIPSYDLTGYGNTSEEALDSLKVMIEEFFRYTTNKNTFFLELKRLGWKIRSKHKRMVAPQMSDLINTNEQLRDIVNHKQFTTSNYQVSMPVPA
jgi:hypothetical protein